MKPQDYKNLEKSCIEFLAKSCIEFDALHAAEKITEKSYKEDHETRMLGFGLLIQNNELETECLKNINDTYFSITFNDFIKVIESNGFFKIYEEEFPYHSYSKVLTERLVVYWHNDGILLHATSHFNDLNGGSIHFNWESNSDSYRQLSGCSHGPIIIGETEPKPYYSKWTKETTMQKEPIYSGARTCSYDIRRGLFLKISDLKENGSFKNPWIDVGFLSLCNYSEDEKKSSNYEKITYEKIKKFPEHVIISMFGSLEKFRAHYEKVLQ